MKELVLRLLIGGTLVSVFALVGDLLRPRSFPGLFGAAPSIALAEDVPGTGTCEKIDFKICGELRVKKIAPRCRISDRWGVSKHLGSKIKSRKLKEINFFTSSGREVHQLQNIRQTSRPSPGLPQARELTDNFAGSSGRRANITCPKCRFIVQVSTRRV